MTEIIDLDALPETAEGFRLVSQQNAGLLVWHPREISLLRSKPGTGQQGTATWPELEEQLRGKRLCNASLLHWMLLNQEKIPEEFAKHTVYFLGTIFGGSGDNLYCYSLRRTYRMGWQRELQWLNAGTYEGSIIAIHAPPEK